MNYNSNMKKLFVILLVTMVTLSCNIDEVIEAEGGIPQITLDSTTGVYTTKVSQSITIAPTYSFVDNNTTYSWTVDNKQVCTTPHYTFIAETAGEIYITISVSNKYGSDSELIRVDIADFEIPTVTLSASSEMSFVVGSAYTFTASVKECSLPTNICWTLNGTAVSEGYGYLFTAKSAGTYTLTVTASNSDGSHSDSVDITVLEEQDMPFIWEFETDYLHGTVGREIVIRPTQMSSLNGVSYYWLSDRQPEDASRQPYYAYTPKSEGRHTIKGTASILQGDEPIVISLLFTLDIYPVGKYYRPATASSVKQWNRVYEYTPAPGQFIGEGYTATTAAEAVEVATQKLSAGTYLSLGGFGGYIVVGFDHSIADHEGYDFAVAGNSFDTSSEPGIVWVMQDENGDGKPNDTWYELAGSETGKSSTVRDYAVTYYRPNGAGMDIIWSDSMGNSGVIKYLPTYHKQDYYYPQWIDAESYTLQGTLLEARNYDKYGNGAMWIQPPYDWGYADNFSSIDRLADGAGSENNAMPNGFDIARAIDHNSNSIKLDYIDFIKVQTACNTSSGWLGENSTEVFDIYDLK